MSNLLSELEAVVGLAAWRAIHDVESRHYAIYSPSGDSCEVHERASGPHAEILRQLAQDIIHGRTHHAEIAAAVSRDDILRELVESWRALERISGNKFERGVFKLCADQVVAAMAQEGAG